MANVHVELLHGRRVRDANNKVVGRIAAIHVRRSGPDFLVEEYHLGPAAFLEVLGISTARLIGFRRAGEPKRIPWQKLDLSDPEHPRFRGTKDELKASSS